LKLIRRLRAEGWRVELIYLALPSMEMSKWRVAERVAHGGHNIPAADIERRFSRSLSNLFNVFSGEVMNCQCFMNAAEKPELVFHQQGEARAIIQTEKYEQLLKEAAR
jgi:predicted ABC-type ATPase